jgi:C4-dicarboxylate transporter DctM subunit
VLAVPVLGGIYFGIMTPTEAAAVGAACALAIGVIVGDLRLRSLMECLKETVKTNCMILFIVLGAQIFSFSLVNGGFNRELTSWVVELNLTTGMLFIMVVILYVILGMFIDGISMMLLTLPLLYPIVIAAGFNPVWFGIAVTVLIEVGQITPPMGLNLFVIHGIADDSLDEVVWGSLPYVVLMLAVLGMMYAYPEIVLWLPGQMK